MHFRPMNELVANGVPLRRASIKPPSRQACAVHGPAADFTGTCVSDLWMMKTTATSYASVTVIYSDETLH